MTRLLGTAQAAFRLSDLHDGEGEALWDALDRAGAGSGSGRSELIANIEAHPSPTRLLLNAGTRHAGGEAARARIDAHLLDENWRRWLPLDAQEYGAVFGQDSRFELNIAEALEASGFARRHLERLCETESAEAALALRAALDGIAEEAATLVGILDRMRARRTDALRMLQVQALFRAELAAGPLNGKRALEVGSEDGGLLAELQRLGAQAIAIDLEPLVAAETVLRGDFMTTPLPGPFDLIIATAVFEQGSCVRGEPEPDARNTRSALLMRLAELTRQGSWVVLENVGFPLPFTQHEAEDAGFAVVRQQLPGVNLALGGRGCAMRRR